MQAIPAHKDELNAAERSAATLRAVACAPAAFDAALAGFLDVPPEQTACFAAHRWRGRDVEHRLYMHGDQVFGAATVVIAGALGIGVAAVKWGPMWRWDRGVDPAIYKSVVAALKAEYAEGRGYFLSIMPPAEPLGGEGFEPALVSLAFAEGTGDPFSDRYFVDLAPAEPVIRAGLAAKWRYNLVKSEAAGFTFRVLQGQRGLDAFHPLYAAMLGRKRFHDDSPVKSLPALLQSANLALYPLTLLVEDAGVPVAAAVIVCAGDTARYLFGASSDDALDRKPGYVMQWQTIRWLKANTACRWYALGGTDGSAGLAQFKKGLVGRVGVICAEPPAFHFAATRRAALAGRLLYGLRAARARTVARLAGTRLGR